MNEQTKREQEVFSKFFYLSNRFTLVRMAEHKYCRMAYTGYDALSGIELHERLTDKHEELENALIDLTKTEEVQDILTSVDLKEECKKPQYKFSTEEQYKYSENAFGKRVCVDDLMED